MNNNKLIAEFMGLSHCEEGWITIPNENRNAVSEDEISNDLQYHTEWNWLMPVVEKIECTHDNKGDCFNVMMEAFECTISGLGLTLCLNGHTKMDATYKAVVEFIKTYNDGR